jgi:hypothetical protein
MPGRALEPPRRETVVRSAAEEEIAVFSLVLGTTEIQRFAALAAQVLETLRFLVRVM